MVKKERLSGGGDVQLKWGRVRLNLSLVTQSSSRARISLKSSPCPLVCGQEMRLSTYYEASQN
jgi:hypothetical protein